MTRGFLDLKDFLNEERLINLPLKGHKYTWYNRRIGKNFIQRRLDRMVFSVKWLNKY